MPSYSTRCPGSQQNLSQRQGGRRESQAVHGGPAYSWLRFCFFCCFFAHHYLIPPNWLGRERELARLQELVHDADYSVIVLDGIGGLGKSSLAWKFCEAIQNGSRERVIWWSFYSNPSFDCFVDQVHHFLTGSDYDRAVYPTVRSRVFRLCELLAKERCIIVLDGFERLTRGYAIGSQLSTESPASSPLNRRACVSPDTRRFLIECCGEHFISTLLITSRYVPADLETEDGRLLSRVYDYLLQALTEESAVAFLKAQGVRGYRQDLLALSKAFDCHPLSLRVISGFVTALFDGDAKKIPKMDATIASTSAKVKRLLMEMAGFLSPEETSLLGELSCWWASVPETAITLYESNFSAIAIRRALYSLKKLGLLEHDTQHSVYTIHPLIRAHFYEKLTDKRSAHLRVRTYLIKTIGELTDKAIANAAQLEQLIELYYHTANSGLFDEAFEIFEQHLFKPMFYGRSSFYECIVLLEWLCDMTPACRPKLTDIDKQVWVLGALGHANSYSGAPAKAAELYKAHNDVLLRLPKLTKDQEADLALIYGSLGIFALLPLGQLREAEENERKRITIFSRIGPTWKEGVGHQELGRILTYCGRYRQAHEEFDTATAQFEEDKKHQSVGLVCCFRALLHLFEGNIDKAHEVASKAYEFSQMSFPEWGGKIGRDEVRAKLALGSVLRAKGVLDSAEQFLVESLVSSRNINFVEIEGDVLLELAHVRLLQFRAEPRQHFRQTLKSDIVKFSQEALNLANVSSYQLKLAEIHNFLAEYALEIGQMEKSRDHAVIASGLATCDGPPHTHAHALGIATNHLAGLGLLSGERKAQI